MLLEIVCFVREKLKQETRIVSGALVLIAIGKKEDFLGSKG